MKKLAFIVPYDEKTITDFTAHLEYFLQKYNKGTNWYKICFIKQKSNRPLNLGKIFNIGFSIYQDNFDYFCFHENDFIPISEECDYQLVDEPTNGVNGVKQINFGEHQDISDFSDFELPYDEYYGGVISCNKKDFLKLNGFSNNYWGYGCYDKDFLNRMIVNDFPMITHIEKPLQKTFITLDGTKSFVKIPCDKKRLTHVTDKNFTLSLWFRVNDFPKYGSDTDTNRCEYFLFGRSGYHLGISITHDCKLKSTIWNYKRQPIKCDTKIRTDIWYNVSVVVSSEKKYLKMFVNGKLVSESKVDGSLYKYGDSNYHIGVGNPTANSWRNFFKGDISEVGIWDESLDENEIKSIFDNGVVNKKGNFSITTPCGFWNFKSGYGNMTFDISGNNNHGYFSSIEFGKKFVKSSTERYLPYRSNGYYAYLTEDGKLKELFNYNLTQDKQIMKNKKVLANKLSNFEKSMQTDGLSTTQFRIIGRDNFKDNHEIIEVML